MKKSLLSFLMVMLCIAFLPKGTSAQDVGGGSADGLLPPPDGGVATAAPGFEPPSFVLNVKRNNGNGHCLGSAVAVLNFKGGFSGHMQLVSVASQKDAKILPALTVSDGWGYWNKATMEFCLNYNIAPKNKLVFHFYWLEGNKDYWIPEM